MTAAAADTSALAVSVLFPVEVPLEVSGEGVQADNIDKPVSSVTEAIWRNCMMDLELWEWSISDSIVKR